LKGTEGTAYLGTDHLDSDPIICLHFLNAANVRRMCVGELTDVEKCAGVMYCDEKCSTKNL